MPEIETLFDWMWKATVVLVCGCGLSALLRSAAERHLAHLLTVAACLLVPLAGLLPVAPLPAPVELTMPEMPTIAIPAFPSPAESAPASNFAFLFWAVGTVGLLAYALLGRVLLSLRSQRSTQPAPGQLLDAAASVAAELGIRRPVKVLVSDGSAS
ncbi:MAG: hypothetical protein JNL98_24590, partial [Bryobacterales bacterium]|nr:hypothetical protein [Bryobacterales bacterium]